VAIQTAPEYAQQIFHSGVTRERRAEDSATHPKALQRDGIELNTVRGSMDQRCTVETWAGFRASAASWANSDGDTDRILPFHRFGYRGRTNNGAADQAQIPAE
jgi:hypothetical protein